MARNIVDAPRSSPDESAAGVIDEESPFRHYVPGERPRSDAAFFELLLCRVVSQPGALPGFDDIWPRAVQALAGLNIFRLANLSGREIAAAITTVGGEFGTRLADKTDSLATWAEAFWRIRQIYGSFRQYVRSFENDGFEALLEDLKQRLPGLSSEFLTVYLREVGEKVPVPPGERSPQAPPRKVQPPPAAPARPAAARPATGNEEKGRRRRRGRAGTPKPQAAAPTTSTAPTAETKPAQPPLAEKASGQSRRNRRRFFRRKRSGGSTAQSQAKSPSTPVSG